MAVNILKYTAQDGQHLGGTWPARDKRWRIWERQTLELSCNTLFQQHTKMLQIDLKW